MLRKWCLCLMALACVVLYSTPAICDVGAMPFVDGTGGDMALSFYLKSSESEYEFDESNDDFDINRTILGVGLSKKVGARCNIYSAFEYLFDGETKDTGPDFELDQGYTLLAGARYHLFQSGAVSGHLYGQFDYILEEVYSLTRNNTDFEIELDGFEITVGGVLRYQINDVFSTSGGLSFVPVMTTSMDLKADGRNIDDDDIEYSDKLGLKIGAQYKIDQIWTIGGEANFGRENAYGISAGAKF